MRIKSSPDNNLVLITFLFTFFFVSKLDNAKKNAAAIVSKPVKGGGKFLHDLVPVSSDPNGVKENLWCSNMEEKNGGKSNQPLQPPPVMLESGKFKERRKKEAFKKG